MAVTATDVCHGIYDIFYHRRPSGQWERRGEQLAVLACRMSTEMPADVRG